MDEKVLLKVEGMDCANCATTISRALTKAGLRNVSVDFLSGDVAFEEVEPVQVNEAVHTITRLGYAVKSRSDLSESAGAKEGQPDLQKKTGIRFLISLLFTIPLVLHMFLPVPLLHSPLFQLAVSLPVMYIGLTYFGKSAFYSLRAGFPNMDVLIFTGSFAAFLYSIIGIVLYNNTPEVNRFLFFETGATIITLVLLGNLIEQRSVRQTTSAITQLSKLQPQEAKKITSVENREEISPVNVSELKKGEIVQVNSGDRIPLDGRVIFGKGSVNESMLTGESIPAYKSSGDTVTGGTILEDGSLQVVIERTGNDTTLSKIIELVREAQHSKPGIQKLGDRISAVFVPVVIIISILTFIVTYLFLGKTLSVSLMNSIAVLVISCPCAMGLATPTAVMVGLGRAAKKGILIKGGSTVETLSKVKTFVFDKTGTLTTGSFKIRNVHCTGIEKSELFSLLYALEKHSSHPIARALQRELKSYSSNDYKWTNVSEDKGIGINATDDAGNLFSAGSFQMVKHFYEDLSHDIYVLKNNRLIAYLDLEDEIKPDAAEVIGELKNAGMRVILLSGDRRQKCDFVAGRTGISEIFSEKLPAEKLEILSHLSKEQLTVMVGDGINDAPSLAMSDVGISISNASEAAIQSSKVILLDNSGLRILLQALKISNMTYSTIRQNLFWAFFYNVLAIPVAAAGYLSPMIGALSMAFSDIIVIGNSLRLRSRKI